MRIREIRVQRVRLESNISNSVVSFRKHDVSLVGVVTDVVRDGKPVVGLAFNSIGRFAQNGIIDERLKGRILGAKPERLLSDGGHEFDAASVLDCVMEDEKPGGHGDRASAVAAVELAIWDLNAKLRGVPAHVLIGEKYGKGHATTSAPVYAAGGYYYDRSTGDRLGDEIRRYRDMGFKEYKIKIGGAEESEDLRRIEEAIRIAGSGSAVAVDANGRFDREQAMRYARDIESYGLKWYEEIGDPLDYELNRDVIGGYGGPVATGENLFSFADARNLMRYGGMRRGTDVFQMEAGLSYGLTEYARIVAMLEDNGYGRKQLLPHGGHLINLHIVLGMGLGGCEAYPGVFWPVGGYPDTCRVDDGFVRASDAPGFGLEEKDGLRDAIGVLLE